MINEANAIHALFQQALKDTGFDSIVCYCSTRRKDHRPNKTSLYQLFGYSDTLSDESRSIIYTEPAGPFADSLLDATHWLLECDDGEWNDQCTFLRHLFRAEGCRRVVRVIRGPSTAPWVSTLFLSSQPNSGTSDKLDRRDFERWAAKFAVASLSKYREKSSERERDRRWEDLPKAHRLVGDLYGKWAYGAGPSILRAGATYYYLQDSLQRLLSHIRSRTSRAAGAALHLFVRCSISPDLRALTQHRLSPVEHLRLTEHLVEVPLDSTAAASQLSKMGIDLAPLPAAGLVSNQPNAYRLTSDCEELELRTALNSMTGVYSMNRLPPTVSEEAFRKNRLLGEQCAQVILLPLCTYTNGPPITVGLLTIESAQELDANTIFDIQYLTSNVAPTVRRARDGRAVRMIRAAVRSFAQRCGDERDFSHAARKLCSDLALLSSSTSVTIFRPGMGDLYFDRFACNESELKQETAGKSHPSDPAADNEELRFQDLLHAACRAMTILVFEHNDDPDMVALQLAVSPKHFATNDPVYFADAFDAEPLADGEVRERLYDVVQTYVADVERSNAREAKLIVPLLLPRPQGSPGPAAVLLGVLVLERPHSWRGTQSEFLRQLQDITSPLVLSEATRADVLSFTRGATGHDPWEESIERIAELIDGTRDMLSRDSSMVDSQIDLLNPEYLKAMRIDLDYIYSILYTYGQIRSRSDATQCDGGTDCSNL